jgi:hypothetical protein
MVRLDELPTRAPSLQSRPVLKARLAGLRRQWDFLALVLLLLGSLPVQWLFPGTLYLSPTSINLIDESWHLDTGFKAERGLWFGRDVLFTYGPLFQWLASAPVRMRTLSMGALYATCTLLPMWCTFAAVCLTVRLLLPEQPAWRRFVLVILLSVFWVPWEQRTPFAIFFFAVFLRAWNALHEQTIRPLLLGCGAALLCVTAFLYSADSGAYAVAALLLSLAVVAWEGRRTERLLRSCLWALLAFLVFSLLFALPVNAFAATPLDFRYWRNSLAILSGYRWVEPATMSKIGKIHLLVITLVGGIVCLMRGVSAREARLAITSRSSFLIGMFVFGLFAMQSGLVRSYDSHIVGAMYVMVCVTGVVLFSFSSRALSAVAVIVAVACSLWWGQPPLLLPLIRQNYLHVSDRVTECSRGFREFDRVCYPEKFTGILQSTVDFLQQHSAGSDFIAVFPYQTIFGVASRRSAAGGVMQTYLVSGAYLSQLDVAGLERADAPAGLFLPDGDQSLPIDGVPNFTRSPAVWLWMFHHYRQEGEPAAGILGLQRDDSRAAKISSQLRPLHASLESYPVRKRSSVLDLGDIAWPADGADFVRLRIKAHYSLWWKLRKPSRLVLELEHADGSYERKPFIVDPNVSSEVWFYPWNDAELSAYFNADESGWRPGSRPAVTRLRLLVMPLDWVSVQPDSIDVQSAEAVRMSVSR